MGAPKDPNSGVGMLRAWLTDPLNADEYLTLDDIAVKFDLTRAQAQRRLTGLRHENLYEATFIYRPTKAKKAVRA